jgi:hypothetical protein
MAAFHSIIYGRFWVITKAGETILVTAKATSHFPHSLHQHCLTSFLVQLHGPGSANGAILQPFAFSVKSLKCFPLDWLSGVAYRSENEASRSGIAARVNLQFADQSCRWTVG